MVARRAFRYRRMGVGVRYLFDFNRVALGQVLGKLFSNGPRSHWIGERVARMDDWR